MRIRVYGEGVTLDSLEFTLGLAKALAWPITVAGLGIAFRQVIRGLLSGRLKQIKAGSVELHFAEELAGISSVIGEAARVQDAEITENKEEPSAPRHISVAESTIADARDLATVAPRAAAVEAFISLEQGMREALLSSGFDQGEITGRPFAHLLREARAVEMVDPQMADALAQLNSVRNRLVHGEFQESDFGASGARDFVETSTRALEVLRRTPNYRVYERRIERELRAVDPEVATSTTSIDSGWDFRVGNEQPVFVEVKFTRHPALSTSVVHQVLGRITALGGSGRWILITNAVPTASTIEMLSERRDLAFVTWRGKGDTPQLIEVLDAIRSRLHE